MLQSSRWATEGGAQKYEVRCFLAPEAVRAAEQIHIDCVLDKIEEADFKLPAEQDKF